ncbi:MAG: WXG100 family type VII secretion target [Labedaea sp.]
MVEQAADKTRWRGFTHKELHKLLNDGAGPAASADPSRRWSELASTLTEVGDDLRAAIGRSGSGWSGRAAGAAYDRLSELVNWAQRTGGNATEMRTAVENQAEHLAKARAEMPVPDDAQAAPADPTAAPALQVLATQRDQEPVEAAASAGQQKAFEVMAAYQHNTDANTGAMATFTAPAQLTGLGDLHRHHDMGIHLTTPALAVGIGLGGVPQEQDHEIPTRSQGQHGHHGWSYQPTIGAGSPGGHESHRPGPDPYSGSARQNQPTFTPGIWGVLGEDGYRRGRTSTGTGGPLSSTGIGGGTIGGSGTIGGVGATSGGGGAPGAGVPGGTGSAPGTRGGVPVTGSNLGTSTGTAIGAGGVQSPDLQSAAAGQLAAAHGTSAAATPGAAAGTSGLTGDHDRSMRRLGADAIGSGQWFGDGAEAEVRGAAPNRRRREFEQPDRVTEAVSIDGEEHNLPPTVIGDGPR